MTPVLVEHMIAPCKPLALPVCRSGRFRFLQPRSGEALGLLERTIAPHFEQAQAVLHAVASRPQWAMDRLPPGKAVLRHGFVGVTSISMNRVSLHRIPGPSALSCRPHRRIEWTDSDLGEPQGVRMLDAGPTECCPRRANAPDQGQSRDGDPTVGSPKRGGGGCGSC